VFVWYKTLLRFLNVTRYIADVFFTYLITYLKQMAKTVNFGKLIKVMLGLSTFFDSTVYY